MLKKHQLPSMTSKCSHHLIKLLMLIGVPIQQRLSLHKYHTALHFGVKAKENQDKVPMLYWLPKLHKKPYKARFIANSSSCTTTELSKLLTSCLTAIKNMLSNIVKKYMRDLVKTYFGPLKIQVKF